MFDAIVTVLDKLVTRPSGRSVVLLVLVLVILGGGFLGFETLTAHFRLARLTATAELIGELQEIQRAGLTTPELARAHAELVKEVSYLVPERAGSIMSAAPPPVAARETLWKFLAGGALWWLVAIFALRSVFRREPSALTGFLGLVVFGAAFGAVGAAIPTMYWPWLNLVMYPLGHFVVILLIIYGFSVDMLRARSGADKLRSAP